VREQVRLLAHVLVDVHALQTLHKNAHRAVGQLDHLVSQSDGTDLIQQLGPRRLGLGVLARDQGKQPIAGEHVVDELDRAFLADGQRDHRVGEHDRIAQRQHRQDRRNLLGHVLHLDLLGIGHASPSPI